MLCLFQNNISHKNTLVVTVHFANANLGHVKKLLTPLDGINPPSHQKIFGRMSFQRGIQYE